MPRILEHRERQQKLEETAADARVMLSQRRVALDDVNTITAYAQDMSRYLRESELTERRAFIESFVKEIMVEPGGALVRYTIPMPEDSLIGEKDAEEMALHSSVLSTVKSGGLGWTHGFQGGQTTLLGPADVMIPHAADHAPEFGSRKPGGNSRPQGAHARRWFLGGHAMPLIPDDELAVGTFQHLHPQAGVASAFLIGQQLQDPPVVLNRVVPSHLPSILVAQDLGEAQIGVSRAVCRFRMLGLHGEAGVVARQEVPQHSVGLVHGAGSGQTQFGYQPVLQGPGCPFHTALGLWRAGEDLPDSQFLQ